MKIGQYYIQRGSQTLKTKNKTNISHMTGRIPELKRHGSGQSGQVRVGQNGQFDPITGVKLA